MNSFYCPVAGNQTLTLTMNTLEIRKLHRAAEYLYNNTDENIPQRKFRQFLRSALDRFAAEDRELEAAEAAQVGREIDAMENHRLMEDRIRDEDDDDYYDDDEEY